VLRRAASDQHPEAHQECRAWPGAEAWRGARGAQAPKLSAVPAAQRRGNRAPPPQGRQGRQDDLLPTLCRRPGAPGGGRLAGGLHQGARGRGGSPGEGGPPQRARLGGAPALSRWDHANSPRSAPGQLLAGSKQQAAAGGMGGTPALALVGWESGARRACPPTRRRWAPLPVVPQISSKEEPRHYSAKIAWNARNNSHMPLLATGAPAINCAVKVRRQRRLGPKPGRSRRCFPCPVGARRVYLQPLAIACMSTASACLPACRLWPLRGGCWRRTAWSCLCSQPSAIGGCGSSGRLWLDGCADLSHGQRQQAGTQAGRHAAATEEAGQPAAEDMRGAGSSPQHHPTFAALPPVPLRTACRSMANSLALYVTSKSKRATEGLIQNVRHPLPPTCPALPIDSSRVALQAACGGQNAAGAASNLLVDLNPPHPAPANSTSHTCAPHALAQHTSIPLPCCSPAS
jgi:hypothetical protein